VAIIGDMVLEKNKRASQDALFCRNGSFNLHDLADSAAGASCLLCVFVFHDAVLDSIGIPLGLHFLVLVI